MFRSLAQALFGRPPRRQSTTNAKPNLPSTDSARRVVLYAHVAESESKPSPTPATASRRRGPINHREWLYAMQLRHLKLCSSGRCDLLEKAGVVSAGDLMTADVESLSRRMGAPETAVRTLKRYRRAIRLAASISGMMPNDAMLLFCIHRRSLQALSLESAAALHRDLQRFALSTRGQRQLRGRRVPSVKRLRRWISSSRTTVAKSLADRPASTPAKSVESSTTRSNATPNRLPLGAGFAQAPSSVYA